MKWRTVIDQEAQRAREAIRLRRPAIGKPGEPLEAVSEPDLIHVRISLAAIGSHTLVQGVLGSRIAVYEFLLWNVAEQDLELLNGSDSLTGPLETFPAQSGMYLPNVGEPHFDLDTGNSLIFSLSAATQVSGFLLYRMVSG